jgi:CheY-like chemotaxis protein
MAASVVATAAARQREARGCRYNQDDNNPGEGRTAEMGAGWAAGATGFIPKPFSEPQLRAEVAAVLQRRPALVDHPA